MRQNYLISGNILAISLSSAADFPFNAFVYLSKPWRWVQKLPVFRTMADIDFYSIRMNQRVITSIIFIFTKKKNEKPIEVSFQSQARHGFVFSPVLCDIPVFYDRNKLTKNAFKRGFSDLML